MRKRSTLPPLLIEVRPSKMLPGQIGLFATRPLKKDTIIAEGKLFVVRFFPWSGFSKIDPITRAKIKQYCIQTKEGFYAPPDFNWLPVPWNMNHCCDYNVGWDKNDSFVIARSVKRGEELCWDYGMGISDPKFKMECRCKSRNCRKLITGNDWKDKVYVKKNKKYFSRDLLKIAEKSTHE